MMAPSVRPPEKKSMVDLRKIQNFKSKLKDLNIFARMASSFALIFYYLIFPLSSPNIEKTRSLDLRVGDNTIRYVLFTHQQSKPQLLSLAPPVFFYSSTRSVVMAVVVLIRGARASPSQHYPMLLRLLIATILLVFKCIPIHANHLLPDDIEEAFRGLLEIFYASRGREFLEWLKQQQQQQQNDNLYDVNNIVNNLNKNQNTSSTSEDLLTPQNFQALDSIFGLECLRGLIRPNMMNQQLVHASADDYDTIGACLTDREGFVSCADANDGDIDKELELISFTKVLDASGAEFRYQSIGPEQLQGVFWLKYDGPVSSIMSFAQSNDGGILSPGVWSRGDDGIDYRARVAGDRIWGFSVSEIDLSDGYNATIFENVQYVANNDNNNRNVHLSVNPWHIFSKFFCLIRFFTDALT
jgi:hypothetical protein